MVAPADVPALRATALDEWRDVLSR